MARIKIAVDCLGGDRSPDANIEGTLSALRKYPDLEAVLYGGAEVITKKLGDNELRERITVVDAPDEVSGEDRPIDAIRMKKNSSMIRAVHDLREDGSISALVSTGATGVLVGSAVVSIGRIEGVRRPPFCPILPTMYGGIVGICDSGANVEVTAEQLRQQAVMGSAYMSCAYGIESPRVALLNVGVESEKGDEVHREAYQLLRGQKNINFVGNMESRDLLSGNYDLIVCDGFSGNVLIKSHEGACLELMKRLKRDIMSKFRYKLGAWLLSRMFREEKEFLNYQNYGGSVLLGLDKIIVKGHGSSNATSVEKCIEQAYNMIDKDLNGKISEML